MDQHPIPRQITTFEFKLIGFLTLRQFIFIAVFSALGVVFFYGIPIPLVNIAATAISVVIGLALAYVRINERPLDVFARNFVRKLLAPSQYFYDKKNLAAESFLAPGTQTRRVGGPPPPSLPPAGERIKQLLSSKVNIPEPSISSDNPFLSGLITNHKNVPLPGILIYIKNEDDKLVRILKSNARGHFATVHPLPDGEYKLEPKDPKNSYFFDAVKVPMPSGPAKSITVVSKELL